MKVESGQVTEQYENFIEFDDDDNRVLGSSSSSSDSQEGFGMHYPIQDAWAYMQREGLYIIDSDDDTETDISKIMAMDDNERAKLIKQLGIYKLKSRSNHQESSEAPGTTSKRHEQTSGVNVDIDENDTFGKDTAMFQS